MIRFQILEESDEESPIAVIHAKYQLREDQEVLLIVYGYSFVRNEQQLQEKDRYLVISRYPEKYKLVILPYKEFCEEYPDT